jgi:hypothetical protein
MRKMCLRGLGDNRVSLSGFTYMLILGTIYGKVIVIAILQIILIVILFFHFGLLGLSVGTFV